MEERWILPVLMNTLFFAYTDTYIYQSCNIE